MVNCNPETVLYGLRHLRPSVFQPLTEDVMDVIGLKPEGVIVTPWWQTPIKLARALKDIGFLSWALSQRQLT